MKRSSSGSAGADRIRAAYYSPKAFRGSVRQQEPATATPPRIGRWVIGALLLAAGFAAGHFWSRPKGVLGGAAIVPPVVATGMPANVPSTGVLAAAPYLPSAEVAPLKVVGAGDVTHCMFELARWGGAELALRVFVRSREVVQAQLPLGRYRGTITCGTQWYGTGNVGAGSTRVLVATPFVFERNAAGALQGVALDMTRRPQGNLPTIRLD